MKICSVSDVHFGSYSDESDWDGMIPECDLLTISGDLTLRGNLNELKRFLCWAQVAPARNIVVIAGNHDFCFERRFQAAMEVMKTSKIVYLQDSATEIEGLKIYGSPWQPWFHDWAFNLKRGPDLAAKWANIPENLDILLVHGPPHGYGDMTAHGERAGCEDLLAAIDAKKPKYTLFGHIHEDVGHWTRNGLELVNCSVGYGINGVFRNGLYTFDIEPQGQDNASNQP